jgi:nitrate reductase NapE component
LDKPDVWAVQDANLISTWIGSTLLVIGLFIQMQPFPLLGWIVSDSETYPPLRTLLNQLLPAWAAFPLLLRLEPHFVNLGLFPGFGWFALCSSLLAVLTGLFQRKWRVGLGSWLAAGFSLSCALLAFSGPVPAMGMLIGVSLGAMVLSGAAIALEDDCTKNDANRKRAIWIKIAVFLGAAAGTGTLGFVSAHGGLRWIYQSIALPGGLTALFLVVLFFFVLLGWRLSWCVNRLQTASEAPWFTILSLFVWILLSLGFVWTGTVTGGVLSGDPDRLVHSFFALFFGTRSVELENASDLITASSLYWGALILAFATAYWTSGRSEDRWMTLADFMPKTSKFLAGGYGIDAMVERINIGITWFGNFAENLIDQKIWSDWVPKILFQGIRTVSGAVNELDFRISAQIGTGLRRSVEIPAKILQLIQTGDLRWYLFFALGSGFALLLHFLK